MLGPPIILGKCWISKWLPGFLSPILASIPCAKPHLEHLLFCPPCLFIADGVFVSPLNVLDYHFWLVGHVVYNQPIHFIGDEGRSQIAVRFLDTFQITGMLRNNGTLPMGLPSSSECMHSPWAIVLHT